MNPAWGRRTGTGVAGCRTVFGWAPLRLRKTSPFSLDFDSLGALGGQNFTSQIVPLGFRRWTPLTRLCDQKHGSRAPWGPSEISKFLAKLPPPYPRVQQDVVLPGEDDQVRVYSQEGVRRRRRQPCANHRVMRVTLRELSGALFNAMIKWLNHGLVHPHDLLP